MDLGQQTNNVSFGERDIDVSISMCCWVGCFPFHCGGCPYKTVLTLEKEEVIKFDKSLCGSNTSKRPYGELGDVTETNCCCCVSLSSAFGEISPGCGCDEPLVREVVEELKARMRARGDTAQILRAEETLKRLEQVEAKLVRKML